MCVLLAALYNNYANEDIPDVDPSDYLTANEEPAAEPSVSPSPGPVPGPSPDDGMRPSGSDCGEGGPIPQGPLKILRSESLLVHKSCGGPLPIGYVDTGLYEGGRRDWFEAFTPRDLTWAIRMDYVLRRHNIYRR